MGVSEAIPVYAAVDARVQIVYVMRVLSSNAPLRPGGGVFLYSYHNCALIIALFLLAGTTAPGLPLASVGSVPVLGFAQMSARRLHWLGLLAGMVVSFVA
jgi:hypothetical protein